MRISEKKIKKLVMEINSLRARNAHLQEKYDKFEGILLKIVEAILEIEKK